MKTKYKAWSRLRGTWIYVWAYSERQAEVLIRKRVQAAIGKFDEYYKVEKEVK